MPPATRSRTTADATRDEATGAGASRDDAPAPESTTLVRADAGTGPGRHGAHGCCRHPDP
jgi:hypothetical protein